MARRLIEVVPVGGHPAPTVTRKQARKPATAGTPTIPIPELVSKPVFQPAIEDDDQAGFEDPFAEAKKARVEQRKTVVGKKRKR